MAVPSASKALTSSTKTEWMNECLTTPQHEKQIGYWVSEKVNASTKTGEKDDTYWSGSRPTASRLPPVGLFLQLLTAPVEPLVAPVDQVALKSKATSPLMSRQALTSRSNSPTTPRWELTHARIKGEVQGLYHPSPWNHRGIAARATFSSLAAVPEGDGQS